MNPIPSDVPVPDITDAEALLLFSAIYASALDEDDFPAVEAA